MKRNISVLLYIIGFALLVISGAVGVSAATAQSYTLNWKALRYINFRLFSLDTNASLRRSLPMCLGVGQWRVTGTTYENGWYGGNVVDSFEETWTLTDYATGTKSPIYGVTDGGGVGVATIIYGPDDVGVSSGNSTKCNNSFSLFDAFGYPVTLIPSGNYGYLYLTTGPGAVIKNHVMYDVWGGVSIKPKEWDVKGKIN